MCSCLETLAIRFMDARQPSQALESRSEKMAREKDIVRVGLEFFAVYPSVWKGCREALNRAFITAEDLLQSPGASFGLRSECGCKVIFRRSAQDLKGSQRGGSADKRHQNCGPVPAKLGNFHQPRPHLQHNLEQQYYF